MVNENFSAERSLEIIQTMIEKTRKSFSDKSQYFLLWGWTVMIGCLGQFVLKRIFDYPYHYQVWWISILCLAITYVMVRKEKKTVKARSYIAESLGNLWVGLGISFVVLSIIFIKMGWLNCYPFFILLYGVGTFTSGRILRFRPFVIGGICCWLLAAVSAWFDFDYQALFAAGAILCGYIIPGYMLKMNYHHKSILND
jgi:hypothetical protein